MADAGEVIQNEAEIINGITYEKAYAYGHDGSDPQKLSVQSDGTVNTA